MKNPSGIAAVAQHAGVSVSTVSQVLGGTRPVSAATRTRVQAAVEELKYRPHPGARSLRSKRTESVALIVPDITNPFYPLVAAGMQDVLLPAGYLLSVNDAALPSRNMTEVLRHVLDRRVDGIALGTYGLSAAHLKMISDSGTQVVALGRNSSVRGGDYVESDDAGGARKIVEHLLETGRKRIAFAGGEQGAHPTQLRLEGFNAAMDNASCPVNPRHVAFASFTRQGGTECAKALMATSPTPDAIVCANDLIAIGVLQELRRAGISVPDDIAVTGYDDIDAAALVTPALTTVENPAREIGRTSARLLLERLTGENDATTRHVTLSNRLIIRESSLPQPSTTKGNLS